jgi:hypothetical protein
MNAPFNPLGEILGKKVASSALELTVERAAKK